MVMPMTTMSAVHEHVHQGTGQQKEVGQYAYDVCQMLRQKEIASNPSDNDQTDRISGTPKARWSFVRRMVMVHSGLIT